MRRLRRRSFGQGRSSLLRESLVGWRAPCRSKDWRAAPIAAYLRSDGEHHLQGSSFTTRQETLSGRFVVLLYRIYGCQLWLKCGVPVTPFG